MASVNFKRRNTVSDLSNIPIEDGNFIITKDGHTFVDFDTDRVSIGGTPDLEMSDSSENSVQNKVVKSYIDNLVNTLKTSLAGTILWQNDSPTNSFDAQTIVLNSSDYDCFEIIYKRTASTNYIYNTGKIPKGLNVSLNSLVGEENNSYLQMRYRLVDYINDTSLSVGDCTGKTTNSNTNTTNNSSTIPLYIIGYKTGLFS